MENKDRTAFPTDGQTQPWGGLTKREWFAGLALQGLISKRPQIYSSRDDVINAIAIADALLEKLNSE